MKDSHYLLLIKERMRDRRMEGWGGWTEVKEGKREIYRNVGRVMAIAARRSALGNIGKLTSEQ